MCIFNCREIVRELQEADEEIKAYRVHCIYRRDGDEKSWKTPFRLYPVRMHTNKLASGRTRAYYDGQPTYDGIYAYRYEFDAKLIENIESRDYGATNTLIVPVWIKPEDILAANLDIIVASAMYMDDEAWAEQRRIVGLDP